MLHGNRKDIFLITRYSYIDIMYKHSDFSTFCDYILIYLLIYVFQVQHI